MRHLFATFLAIVFLVLPWFFVTYPDRSRNMLSSVEWAGDQFAAVILGHRPKTVAEIQAKYHKPVRKAKVRILLVPGHEAQGGGTEFRDVKERDVVMLLASELRDLLLKNDRYEVFMTRNEVDWSPEFLSYFKNHWNEIVAWQAARRYEVESLMELGKFERSVPLVEHLDAPSDMAMRLYGVNKWAGEHDMDIIIHLHVNDYFRSRRSEAGEYSGFAIYVPERQYYNSTTTQVLAKTILKRLEKYNPVSDLPGESAGIIEDQELIAVGSYNTVDAASMLIEYGYIYEPQFVNPDTRRLAAKDLAYQTYIGLMDFFDPKEAASLARFYDTVALPYEWKGIEAGMSVEGPEVFALQTALLLDGVYPPDDKSKNDCPRTGRLGPCTKRALGDFQKKYGVTGERDTLGAKTMEVLNRVYGTEI